MKLQLNDSKWFLFREINFKINILYTLSPAHQKIESHNLRLLYKILRRKVALPTLEEVEAQFQIDVKTHVRAFPFSLDEMEEFFSEDFGSKHKPLFAQFCLSVLKQFKKLEHGDITRIKQEIKSLYHIETSEETAEIHGLQMEFDELMISMDNILEQSKIVNELPRELNNFENDEKQTEYLKDQNFKIKNRPEAVDPNLLQELGKISLLQKSFTLHLYHTYITRNEELAHLNLDDYFASLTQKGQRGDLLYSEEELTNLLRTRPYRNYVIALALMYKTLGDTEKAIFACNEAMSITEGFSDPYNKQIHFSAEILLRQLTDSRLPIKLSKICPNLSLSCFLEDLKYTENPQEVLKKLDHCNNFISTWTVEFDKKEATKMVLLKRRDFYKNWGYPCISKLHDCYLENSDYKFSNDNPVSYLEPGLRKIFNNQDFELLKQKSLEKFSRIGVMLAELNLSKNSSKMFSDCGSVHFYNDLKTLNDELNFNKVGAHFAIFQALQLSQRKNKQSLSADRLVTASNYYMHAGSILSGNKNELDNFCYYLAYNLLKLAYGKSPSQNIENLAETCLTKLTAFSPKVQPISYKALIFNSF